MPRRNRPTSPDKFMQFFRMGPFAQTVNDTDINQAYNTPTNPAEGLVMAVHMIQMGAFLPPLTNASYVEYAICTRGDIPYNLLVPSTHGVIDQMEYEVRFTTSGAVRTWMFQDRIYPRPFLIANPTLWGYIHTALTATVHTFNAKIGFTFEYVSAEEFFQALAAFGD